MAEGLALLQVNCRIENGSRLSHSCPGPASWQTAQDGFARGCERSMASTGCQWRMLFSAAAVPARKKPLSYG